MKKPEKSLLISIAKHIVKDEPTISDKEIRIYFQRILDDLPHGALHEKLIQHKKKHALYLIRKVRRLHRQRAELVPHNGVTANGTAPSGVAVETGTGDEAEAEDGAGSRPVTHSSSLLFDIGVRVNHILQSEKYVDATGKRISQLWSQIPKNALGPECAGLDQHCVMLMMTEAGSSPGILYNILHHCYRCLAKDLSDIRERSSAKSARKKFQSVDKFLRMFLLRRSRFTEERTEFPSVVDLLMAVVSMYLDLFILAHRDREETGRQEVRGVRGVVKQGMAGAGEKALDVLLQMTAHTPDAAVLCPLVRYVLREKPGKRSHSHYLRYVLTACLCKHLWAHLADVVAETRMVRAPKGFLAWLKRWSSPEVCEQLPSQLEMKGLKVTAFLLDHADHSVIPLLLKVLASYEKGKTDDDVADRDQQEEGTQQGTSEKAGSKKKKKKKKKLFMAGEGEGSDRKRADLSVTNDRASDVSGDEDDADLPEPTPQMEVFDLTNLGEGEVSGNVSSGDLFMIDRGRKRTADTVNSDSAELPTKKKKKQTMRRGPSPAPAPQSENAAFFIDRGHKQKAEAHVQLQGSDSASKKTKKKKGWKLGSEDDGEDRPGTAEPEQEAAALPSPAQSAASEEPRMKKKKKGSVESSPALAAVSKPVEEEGGGGFFIDRGEKTLSSVTREEPKRKRKKVSESGDESPVAGLDASAEGGHPSNESIVPDSFSEMEAESDVVMVPDLRVHLKPPQSPGLNSSQEDLRSKEKSPGSVPQEKAASTPSCSSPLSPTFSPEKIGKAPSAKRKPRDRSSHSVGGAKGSSLHGEEEQGSEEAPRKSRSPSRPPKKRRSSVEGERRSCMEEVQKTPAATKKSPSEAGRRKSSEDIVPQTKSSVSGAKLKSPGEADRSKRAGEADRSKRAGEADRSKRAGEADRSKRAGEADRSKRAAEKAKTRKSSVKEAETEKQSESAATPQEESSEPKKKRTPKSTTPVSRRTRSQRKSTLPHTTKSPKAAETEPQPADKTAHPARAKPPSPTAQSAETASPAWKSQEAAASISQPQPDAAKAGTALKSKTPRSSKADKASVVAPEPTATSKRKSLPSKSAGGLYASLQKRATRKSMGPQEKSSETHTRQTGKPPTEKEASFTKLKPVATSPTSPAHKSRKAASAEGAQRSPGKASPQKAAPTGKTTPLKKASLATEASGSPDRLTRSQSYSKGYNLRKSIQQDQ